MSNKNIFLSLILSSEGTVYELVVPPNSIAHVELQVHGNANVPESRQAVNQAEGVKVLPPQSLDSVRMKVLSGHYKFKLSKV